MPLEDFTARPLDEYLDEQAKDGVYGDKITLIANHVFPIDSTLKLQSFQF